MRKMAKKVMISMVTTAIVMSSTGVSSINNGNISIQVQAAKKKLTKKQARIKVVNYLKKKKEWKSYYYLDYDHKSGNEYVFHYYEMMSDHTATINWYEVNIKTGKITSMF